METLQDRLPRALMWSFGSVGTFGVEATPPPKYCPDRSIILTALRTVSSNFA